MKNNMKLTISNFRGNSYNIFKILNSRDKEILRSKFENNDIVIKIPKEYKDKQLKLVIENSAFSGTHKKSIKELVLYLITCLGVVNEQGFMGNPLNYVYEFIIHGDSSINFRKRKSTNGDFFESFDKNISTINQEKIIYKQDYSKWLIYSIVPLEILISFLAFVFGAVFSKYLLIVILGYGIINLFVFNYAYKIKKGPRILSRIKH